MATTICSSDRFVSSNLRWDCVTSSATAREFSEFLRAMELISSVEAEVSSSDAACSEAPCARDWLEEETCEAALAVCSAVCESSPTTRRRLAVICRLTNQTANATSIEANTATPVNQRLRDAEACA